MPVDLEELERLEKAVAQKEDYHERLKADLTFLYTLRNAAPAMIAELKERREADRWIPVEERLPELNVPVALMDVTRHTHHVDFGDPMTLSVMAAGYLAKHSSTFWAVRGEPALCVGAFTHWRPLPEGPDKEARKK